MAVYLDSESTNGDNARAEDAPADAATTAVASRFKFDFSGEVRRAEERQKHEESTEEHTEGNKNNYQLMEVIAGSAEVLDLLDEILNKVYTGSNKKRGEECYFH